MRVLKILVYHFVIWFLFSGIVCSIMAPKISTENVDFNKISEGIPTSAIVISIIYLLGGWIIPYKYFKTKMKTHE